MYPFETALGSTNRPHKKNQLIKCLFKVSLMMGDNIVWLWVMWWCNP